MPKQDERPAQAQKPSGGEKSKDEIDRDLDSALADTFPAGDPVSMEIPARKDPRKKNTRFAPP